MSPASNPRIKVTLNGPYIVHGGIKLTEKIITPAERGSYVYAEGRTYEVPDTYALCRCGKSKVAPFCDGSHDDAGFVGTETASREPYDDRAKVYSGPELDLLDDGRCGLARFCHRENSEVWTLTSKSDDPKLREAAIRAAQECPAGRLTTYDKDGNELEPDYAPAIEVLQDPQRGVSGGLAVKGFVPLESADGNVYELRNRVLLCRCGGSRNKPFCDASHVSLRWKDGQK